MRFIVFIILFCADARVWAQDNKSDRNPQIGAFIGNILPNGIEGADEIFPLWGLRYSHPVGKLAYSEFGGLFGNSEGVAWQGLFVDMRMDIPIETLVAITYIGLDLTRYSGTGHEMSTHGGGHVGGGMMSLIGGSSWVRFDMKLNSKPGTSLYFALGLVFEWDSSSDTGGSE